MTDMKTYSKADPAIEELKRRIVESLGFQGWPEEGENWHHTTLQVSPGVATIVTYYAKGYPYSRVGVAIGPEDFEKFRKLVMEPYMRCLTSTCRTVVISMGAEAVIEAALTVLLDFENVPPTETETEPKESA